MITSINNQEKAFQRTKFGMLIMIMVFFVSGNVNAQLIYNESFESSPFVNTQTMALGWLEGNYGPGTDPDNFWVRSSSGTFPACSPHSGASMMRFPSWYINSGEASYLASKRLDMRGIPAGGTQCSFWMYRDNGWAAYPDRVQVFLNQTPDMNGSPVGPLTEIGSGLTAINRSCSLAPVVTGAQCTAWNQYTYNIPQAGNITASLYVILVAISGDGNDIYIDDFSIQTYPLSQNYVANSASVISQNISPTAPNQVNQQIIGCRLTTSGAINPRVLSRMIFNTNGSTNPAADIANAKLWFSGGTYTFSTENAILLGTYSGPVASNDTFLTANWAGGGTGYSGLVNFNGLEHGDNYFWLTYDIKPGAISGDYVDAEWTKLTISGYGVLTPSLQTLPGARLIGTPSWLQVGNYNSGCDQVFFFTANGKGYVGGGRSALNVYKNDFWEFDPVTQTWTQKANYGGGSKSGQFAFEINNKGYVGCGMSNSGFHNDVWQYDPLNNTWTQKALFPGAGRSAAASFAINGTGYVTNGGNTASLGDCWAYDPITNVWSPRNNFPAPGRTAPNSFVIDGFGYMVNGIRSATVYNELWQYNPITDTWLQKANFPGTSRYAGSAFVLGNIAYVGLGKNTPLAYLLDYHKYNPLTNSWSFGPTYNGGSRISMYSIPLSNTAYVGVGMRGPDTSPQMLNDVWKYTNTGCTVPPTPGAITATINAKACPGDTRTFTIPSASGATSYTWTPPMGSAVISGQGTTSVNVLFNSGFLVSDSIRVVANNACGSSGQRKLKVTRNNPVVPAAISGSNFNVCNQLGVPYSVTNVTGITYNWSFSVPAASVVSGQGNNNITANFGAGYISSTLSVNATNACGTSANRNLTVYAKPTTPLAITGLNSVCANDQNVPYSIAPVAGAVNYTWGSPTGSHVSDGTITSTGTTLITTATSVTVDFGISAGSIKVRANNACASGSYRTLSVAMPCRIGMFDEEISSEFNITPNPNKGSFMLHFDETSTTIATIIIVDAMGRVVYEAVAEKENDQLLDLNLASGIYQVVCIGEKDRLVKKMIVE